MSMNLEMSMSFSWQCTWRLHSLLVLGDCMARHYSDTCISRAGSRHSPCHAEDAPPEHVCTPHLDCHTQVSPAKKVHTQVFSGHLFP